MLPVEWCCWFIRPTADKLQHHNKRCNNHSGYSHLHTPSWVGIRASVDALCRDGASEISRDPRTKRLQTRRESLARPSKHTNNNLLDSYLAVHKSSSFLPASSLPRENLLTRDFHNFRVIIIIIIISKPASSLLEAMIFSPNVSRVDGGVHGHQAIVIGSLCITTVDHGAQEGKGCTTPFAPCHMTDWSFAHARPERDRA